MVRIALWSLVAVVSAAPVVAKADGWHVALPERRGVPKIAGFAPVQAGPGPSKVALPLPTTRKRARPDDDVELTVAASPTRAQRRSAAADDPDMPIAREDVRPRAQRYGPERLRAGYHAPSGVSATAYSIESRGPRVGGIANSSGEIDPNRGFADHIRGKREQLQVKEGAPQPAPAQAQIKARSVTPPVAGIYSRLHDLQGYALASELGKIGDDIVQRNPIGTSVAKLRTEYAELVLFISERTNIPAEQIYRVMDLESSGGQWWAEHPTSGAVGVVQVAVVDHRHALGIAVCDRSGQPRDHEVRACV